MDSSEAQMRRALSLHPMVGPMTDVRWVAAAQRALDWMLKPRRRWLFTHAPAAPAAVLALVCYLRPQSTLAEVMEVLAAPDFTAWLWMAAHAQGHRLSPSPLPGGDAAGDPVVRAWHAIGDKAPGADPVADAALWVLAAAHHSCDDEDAPTVMTPLPTPVRVLPSVEVPRGALSFTLLDAQQPRAFSEVVRDLEDRSRESWWDARVLVTCRARSWLWLAQAAAAHHAEPLVVAAAATSPRSLTMVSIAKLHPCSPHQGKLPRFSHLDLHTRQDPVHHPLLWPGVLAGWPMHPLRQAVAGRGQDECPEVVAATLMASWEEVPDEIAIDGPQGRDLVVVERRDHGLT